MLHASLEFLQPLLVDLLAAAAIAVLTIVGRWVPVLGRLFSDQRHRDALHRAIDTGVDLALATTETGARAVPGLQAIDTALGYVQRSTPGALKHFFGDNATLARNHLRDMILAKIEAKTLSADDPLTGALRGAGAPVEAGA